VRESLASVVPGEPPLGETRCMDDQVAWLDAVAELAAASPACDPLVRREAAPALEIRAVRPLEWSRTTVLEGR